MAFFSALTPAATRIPARRPMVGKGRLPPVREPMPHLLRLQPQPNDSDIPSAITINHNPNNPQSTRVVQSPYPPPLTSNLDTAPVWRGLQRPQEISMRDVLWGLSKNKQSSEKALSGGSHMTCFPIHPSHPAHPTQQTSS
jgi:hypothetical protein